ncbi:MAG: MBL fold metallo-hydrolase [Verrucomicrobia bacterium]|nr:MBL fold metallo-hydrolase [Verrucomicrobiota bacterium]
MKTFAALTSLALCAVTAFAQQNYASVEIKTTHVAGNVYMLEGSGGNIGVSVGPDGVLMVDNEFLPLAAKIEAAVAKLNPGPLKFMLNTHWHGDHTGGNAHFGKKGVIIAHQNARLRLGSAAKPAPPEAMPVVTVNDTASVHFNGEEIRLWHVGPGHTDGDVIIHFTKSGVLHMGDQFVNPRFPFIDFASGGDVQGYIKTVGNVLAQCDDKTKIIPGHGALATKADLKKFHDMLTATSGVVKKAIAAGKSLADIKADPAWAQWKEFGAVAGPTGSSRYIEALYNGLGKK